MIQHRRSHARVRGPLERERVPIRKVETGRRLLVLLTFFVCLASAVFLKTVWLQLHPAVGLEKLAVRQHEKTIEVPGVRGSILDRNGAPLASSIPVYSLYGDPQQIENPREASQKLGKILALSSSKIFRGLSSEKRFVWIKRQMSDREETAVRDLKMKGLGFIKESKRVYPQGMLASTVLGFVGLDGQGLDGLELRLQPILQGGTLRVRLPYDARGRPIDIDGDLANHHELSGFDVTLTIDSTIQHIAERELEGAIVSSRAKSGNIVVLDAKTADVLAMASAPSFDPNRYSDSSAADRRNRTVVDSFEPGSTFKPLVMAALLEDQKVRPGELVNCENGRYPQHGTAIHDVKPKGILTIEDVIKYSSNIGMYKLAQRISPQSLDRSIRRYGFGSKTGVSLLGETRGGFPAWKSWRGVTQGNLGFGHGIAASTLQVARAYTVFTSGGDLLTPRLLRGMSRTSEEDTVALSDDLPRSHVLSPKVVKRLTNMMVHVTEPGGTGELAQVPGYRVAGKTGTSQKPDERGKYSKEFYVSSFAGFVPADDPKLIVVVTVDEPQGEIYGGLIAAPVFRRIAEQSLIHLGVKPNRDLLAKQVSVAKAEPAPQELRAVAMDLEIHRSLSALASQAASRMPDLRGMTLREALRHLDPLGLRVTVKGSGVVTAQRPAAGAELKGKADCELTAKPAAEPDLGLRDDASDWKKRI